MAPADPVRRSMARAVGILEAAALLKAVWWALCLASLLTHLFVVSLFVSLFVTITSERLNIG